MSKRARQVAYGLLIVAGFGGAAYSFLGRSSPAKVRDTLTIQGLCLSCKHEGTVQHPNTEPAPHKCPQCGQLAVYPLMYCFDCRRRFVPDLVRTDPSGPPRIPPSFRCPGCRSANVMQFIPNQPELEPVGDLPPPRWN